MSKRILSSIDIGSYKIAALIVAFDFDEQVSNFNVIGYSVIPSSGVKKGIVVNINETSSAIQEAIIQAEKMAGISITEAFVSINGKSILSNNTKGVVAITDQEINEYDVSRALENVRNISIPAQLRKLIHILPREYIIDTQGGIKQPLGMVGSRLEVNAHVISALTTTVLNVEKIFEQISIQMIPVFAGLASSYSVLTPTEKELGVILLDIGYGTTTITIYQEDSVAYNAVINLGSQAITNDIAVGLQIRNEDAEKIKVNLGSILNNSLQNKPFDDNNAPFYLKADNNQALHNQEDLLDLSFLQISSINKISKKIIDDVVDSRLEEIFSLVANSITSSGFSLRQPAGIVLTGGGSKLHDISKKASKFFNIHCRVGYPQGLSGPLIDEVSSPDFACSQGLILFGLEMLNNSVDLNYNSINTNKNKGFLQKIYSFLKNML